MAKAYNIYVKKSDIDTIYRTIDNLVNTIGEEAKNEDYYNSLKILEVIESKRKNFTDYLTEYRRQRRKTDKTYGLSKEQKEAAIRADTKRKQKTSSGE